MTVSEQVAPVVADLRYNRGGMSATELAKGVELMAFEIDRLRARLRLVGVALTLLAIAAGAVMLRA